MNYVWWDDFIGVILSRCNIFYFDDYVRVLYWGFVLVGGVDGGVNFMKYWDGVSDFYWFRCVYFFCGCFLVW